MCDATRDSNGHIFEYFIRNLENYWKMKKSLICLQENVPYQEEKLDETLCSVERAY